MQATMNSVRCSAAVKPFRGLTVVVRAGGERLRLGNLAPEPGSRRDEKRKGRGYAAGQVSTGGNCGALRWWWLGRPLRAGMYLWPQCPGHVHRLEPPSSKNSLASISGLGAAS